VGMPSEVALGFEGGGCRQRIGGDTIGESNRGSVWGRWGFELALQYCLHVVVRVDVICSRLWSAQLAVKLSFAQSLSSSMRAASVDG
jgi:hypothetical protein